jgi:hypothetical protein
MIKLVNPDFILVKYRYAIAMPDKVKLYDTVLQDWLTTKFESIYKGKTLLLVSPLFEVANNTSKILVQISIDVEGKEGTEKAFNYCRTVINKYDFLSMVYTGKTGFHLFSNFTILTDNMPITQLRHEIMAPLKIASPLIDLYSGIRDMPIVRIGLRENKRIAFPVPKNISYQKFLQLTNTTDFSFMTQKDLKNFIKEYILPSKQISYNQFLSLV